MKTLKKISLSLVGFTFIFTQAFSQKVNTNESNVAIEGYDLVAYQQGKALKGSSDHSITYQSTVYHFSSSKNASAFKKNPNKYLPAYGGFCATAVATSNAKFPVDPETFHIQDGKLYLFYNGPYNGSNFNGKEPWLEDEKGLKKKADENWKTLENKQQVSRK